MNQAKRKSSLDHDSKRAKYEMLDRRELARILRDQENFKPLPKPEVDLETLFYFSTSIFDNIICHLPIESLVSLMVALNLPEEICLHCCKVNKDFVKEYFSYLITLPPSEDELLIQVSNYVEIKELEKSLYYPRSEKYLLFLEEKGILKPSYIKGIVHFYVARGIALKYQTLPQSVVERLWNDKDGIQKDILKDQKVSDSMLESAVDYIQKYRYSQHTEEQIKEYAIKDPIIFKYELEDMPTTSVEFIEFLKSAQQDPHNITFKTKLFGYVCNHIELASQLLPLFQSDFIEYERIIVEYGLKYQDTNLSMKLLEYAEEGSDEMRILKAREWDPVNLFKAWNIGYGKPRVIMEIIEYQLDTKFDRIHWEDWVPLIERIPLFTKRLRHLPLAFFKRYPEFLEVNLSYFWEREHLDLLDGIGEVCLQDITTCVFFYIGPIDWQWASRHKFIWEGYRYVVTHFQYYMYLHQEKIL
jgi:hypothetical protein